VFERVFSYELVQSELCIKAGRADVKQTSWCSQAGCSIDGRHQYWVAFDTAKRQEDAIGRYLEWQRVRLLSRTFHSHVVRRSDNGQCQRWILRLLVGSLLYCTSGIRLP